MSKRRSDGMLPYRDPYRCPHCGQTHGSSRKGMKACVNCSPRSHRCITRAARLPKEHCIGCGRVGCEDQCAPELLSDPCPECGSAMELRHYENELMAECVDCAHWDKVLEEKGAPDKNTTEEDTIDE